MNEYFGAGRGGTGAGAGIGTDTAFVRGISAARHSHEFPIECQVLTVQDRRI